MPRLTMVQYQHENPEKPHRAKVRCETMKEELEMRTPQHMENGGIDNGGAGSSTVYKNGNCISTPVNYESTDAVVTKKRVVNLKARRYGQIFITEFVATTLLMFMVCMGCMDGITKGPISPLQSPLASGFAVATLVQVFGHVSGAHMNPAVTVCFWALGKVDITTSLVYFVAELLGATCGYGILEGIIPQTILAGNPGRCETRVHPELSNTGAAIFEFIITGILIFLICGLTDSRNESKQDSAAIKFGLAIICLSFVGGSLTGASLNPARTFGPAIWNGSWDSHWVYWAGPMAAGFIVPKFYQLLFEKDLEKSIDL